MARRPAPWAPGQPLDGVFTGRIATVPNMISFVRLIGVPLFLWLLVAQDAKLAALIVLAIGGTTDWVDGWVARRLGQVSRLGELLDPFVDRLYIVATLVAFTLTAVVPWEFTAALVAREAVLVVCLLILRAHGYGPPPVHYVGKSATFMLLVAFPILLLSQAVDPASAVAHAIGWACAIWGLVLYWIAAFFYIYQVSRLIRVVQPASDPA
jgi:cardiolipin synthase (CMP-forming)